MQAAAAFSLSQPLPLPKPTLTSASPLKCIPRRRLGATRLAPVRAFSISPDTSSTVDYSSTASVFPAEACETIGGDACSVEMYPESKLVPEANKNKTPTATEDVDREYVEYNSNKTVFPGEACDDLGGEFCGADYQKGVY